MPRRLYIPLHLLILIPLLAISLPLALFALLTTALALLTLLARLTVVYLDLALALLTSWIPPLLPLPTAARKRRSRASTGTSPRPALPPVFATAAAAAAGGGAATPSPRLSRRTSRSDSHASVVLGLGAAPDRDYEGVGGWRLVDDGPAGGSAGRGGGGDGDRGGGDGDEATWVGWSSRPEPSASGGALGRPRSLTASSASAATMLQDRARRGAAAAGGTGVEREDDGGYFGQTHELKRPTSGSVTTSLEDDEVNHHDFSKS
jgi:hypothetical protein